MGEWEKHCVHFLKINNWHYNWSAEESDLPFSIVRMQTRPKLTVWCGFTAVRLFCTTPWTVKVLFKYSDETGMTTSSYFVSFNDKTCMQDGATPHYALVVREWLQEWFPAKWNGRRGSHHWLARSPDFTPRDFFCGDEQKIFQDWEHKKETFLETFHRFSLLIFWKCWSKIKRLHCRYGRLCRGLQIVLLTFKLIYFFN